MKTHKYKYNDFRQWQHPCSPRHSPESSKYYTPAFAILPLLLQLWRGVQDLDLREGQIVEVLRGDVHDRASNEFPVIEWSANLRKHSDERVSIDLNRYLSSLQFVTF